MHSATFRHFESSLEELKWLLTCVLQNKKSLKTGNAFLAKLADVVVGVFLVNVLINNQRFIFNGILDLTEVLILNA